MEWIDTTDITAPTSIEHLGRKYDASSCPAASAIAASRARSPASPRAREQRIPFLGICLGFQVAVIEYARNVLGIEGANSTEFDPERAAEPVISELPEQKEIEGLGGTMRLGAQDVVITPNASPAGSTITNQTSIHERFRHRYEVDPRTSTRLSAAGLIFSGRHPEHPIMQVLELRRDDHPYFVAGQFHPELTSRPLQPPADVHGAGRGGYRPRPPR
jgi:CTP synthase